MAGFSEKLYKPFIILIIYVQQNKTLEIPDSSGFEFHPSSTWHQVGPNGGICLPKAPLGLWPEAMSLSPTKSALSEILKNSEQEFLNLKNFLIEIGEIS